MKQKDQALLSCQKEICFPYKIFTQNKRHYLDIKVANLGNKRKRKAHKVGSSEKTTKNITWILIDLSQVKSLGYCFHLHQPAEYGRILHIFHCSIKTKTLCKRETYTHIHKGRENSTNFPLYPKQLQLANCYCYLKQFLLSNSHIKKNHYPRIR